MPAGAPKIEIPRWIQLIGLPLVLLFVWTMATAVGHVVFLFLVAALIALLLDPLVRALGRLRIPRGFSIAVVYLTFAAAVVVAAIAIGAVVIDQSREAADRISRLPYDRARTEQSDGRRARRRPAPGLARRPRSRAHRGQRTGPGLRRLAPPGGPAGVHVPRNRLSRRCGALDLRAALQPRPDPRRLDLHAPRHGTPLRRGRPALPAAAGLRLARPAARERARRLRPRPGPAVADHRRRAPESASGSSGRSAGRRGWTATRCSSRPGSERWS